MLNVVWLLKTIVAPGPPLRADEAYAECRAAVRRLREDAARIPFPTTDLIRVTRRDAVHHVVRGYYIAAPAPLPTRYTCELSALPGATGFRVDTIAFE